MSELKIKPGGECRWDCVSLGEVMLRFDPEDERIHTTRAFKVWEGGGEYNVARALRRCFDRRTAIVTALVDNPLGRLAEDLMLQGGVDLSLVRWVDFDGVGHASRNGLYFLERGYGVRGARACYDRAHTAVSQLRAGDIDWRQIFDSQGARWFHTGGIFAGLSETTPDVAREAMRAARAAGTIVSYDANYRSLLWARHGGRAEARRVNHELAQHADVIFGTEDDFIDTAAASSHERKETDDMRASLQRLHDALPGVRVIATTRRTVLSASRNEWGAAALADGEFYETPSMEVEVLDRVGSGDGFAAGVIHGLLEDQGAQWSLSCGVAHGALAMTTPGDSSMATLADVERLMRGDDARAAR